MKAGVTVEEIRRVSRAGAKNYLMEIIKMLADDVSERPVFDKIFDGDRRYWKETALRLLEIVGEEWQ